MGYLVAITILLVIYRIYEVVKRFYRIENYYRRNPNDKYANCYSYEDYPLSYRIQDTIAISLVIFIIIIS